LIDPHVDLLNKAISFALIGVVNALIDTGIFLTAYSYLNAAPAALRPLDAIGEWCGCASHATVVLITSNIAAWLLAVSCSYAMNSFFTFAAESGRRLTWAHYGTFVASGILGAVANTTTLVLLARLMPVLAAKGGAILVGFLVNFSMSHFFVFRRRPEPAMTRDSI
jgi:putative flippase GtrA